MPDQVDEAHAIRDVLFGDLPLDRWPSESSAQTEEPWLSFVRAREQFRDGDTDTAKQTLRSILAQPDLESRHYLQAWHFLGEAGEEPSRDEAKRLYGVVVEVALEGGLDIVAAYADHTARYFNYTGAGVVWDRADDSLDASIDALLEAGRVVVARIGPWEDKRPAAPAQGEVRINMLTPSGLHFGQAPYEVLAKDPMGGPVINAALLLMQGLIAKTADGQR